MWGGAHSLLVQKLNHLAFKHNRKEGRPKTCYIQECCTSDKTHTCFMTGLSRLKIYFPHRLYAAISPHVHSALEKNTSHRL